MSDKLELPDPTCSTREEIRAFWERMVTEVEQSGSSLKKFSTARGIPVHRLAYWKTRLRGAKGRAMLKPPIKNPEFIPVRLLAEKPLEPVTIYIGQFSRIELLPSHDSTIVKTILSLLMEA